MRLLVFGTIALFYYFGNSRVKKKGFRFAGRLARFTWFSLDGLIRGGVWATVTYFILIAGLSLLQTCDETGECQRKISAFLASSPNEVGDAIAGLAGSLAFLWIIVTVLLQSKELRAQREELSLTRFEISRMAQAQTGQLNAMEAQTAVLRADLMRKEQEQAKAVFEVALTELQRTIKRTIMVQIEFGILKLKTPNLSQRLSDTDAGWETRVFRLIPNGRKGGTGEQYAKQLSDSICNSGELILLSMQSEFSIVPEKEKIISLLDLMKKLSALKAGLSKDQLNRFESIGFDRALCVLSKLEMNYDNFVVAEPQIIEPDHSLL